MRKRFERDPLDVRKENLYGPGRDVTPYGMRVEEPHILRDILEKLEVSSEYRARRAAIKQFNGQSRYIKRGLALTPVQFGISFTLKHLNQAGALIHVYQDGSIHVNHGGAEMGQGLHTKVASIVARVWCVSGWCAHHRNAYRQGAQCIADSRFIGDRPEWHGGASCCERHSYTHGAAGRAGMECER